MAGKMYKNQVRLKRADDVRRMLARTVQMLDAGEINTDTARAYGYLADKILKALHAVELEERLENLEKEFLELNQRKVVNFR